MVINNLNRNQTFPGESFLSSKDDANFLSSQNFNKKNIQQPQRSTIQQPQQSSFQQPQQSSFQQPQQSTFQQPQQSSFKQPQQSPAQQPEAQPPVVAQQKSDTLMPVLEVVGLTKKYGERYAVNGISFKMFPGQIVGFLGANGAGKSTTIKMLTGLAKITSGDAYICGRSVADGFESAIQNVGAMIETPIFYPYLSGFNNLKFFAKLSGNVKNERINYVASLVGLGNRIKDKVGNYSLGMKQRLGVAQALLNCWRYSYEATGFDT